MTIPILCRRAVRGAMRKNNLLIAGAMMIGAALVIAGFSVASSNGRHTYAKAATVWTQPAGRGLTVPACGSSVVNSTCQAGSPVVLLTMDPCSEHPSPIEWAVYFSGIQFDVSQGAMGDRASCGSTVEWSAAKPRVASDGAPHTPLAGHTYAWDTAKTNGHDAPYSQGTFTTSNTSDPQVTITYPPSSSFNFACGKGIVVDVFLKGGDEVYSSDYQPCDSTSFTIVSPFVNNRSSNPTGAAGLAPDTFYTYDVRTTDANGATTGYPIVSQSFRTPACNVPAISTIQGYKVLMPGNDPNPNPPAGFTVRLDDGSPITSNPYTYAQIPAGSHTVSVSVPAGWNAGYTMCINNTNCHGNAPTAGNSVAVDAPAGGYVDLWWHLTPSSAPLGGGSQLPTVTLQAPSIVSLPNPIGLGWTATNIDGARGDTCTASGDWSGQKSVPNGSESVTKPRGTYTFTLTCKNAQGQASDSRTVRVVQLPACSFGADPHVIIPGGSSLLSWNCQYANACSIDNGIGNVSPTGGTTRVSPTMNTTYTLQCSDQDGRRYWDDTITVGFIPKLKEILPPF